MYEASIIMPTHPDDLIYAHEKASKIVALGNYEIIIDSSIGLARSTFLGIERAHSERVIIMDCDTLHPISYIPTILALLDRYDIVKCSRATVTWGLQGTFSNIGNIVAELMLGCGITDYTTKFYGGYRSKLLSLDCWHGHFDYIMELLYSAKCKGWSIEDMTFVPDLGGDNGKVSHTKILRDSRDYIKRMVQVRREYGNQKAKETVKQS